MSILDIFKQKKIIEKIDEKNKKVRMVIFFISIFFVALIYNLFFVKNNLVIGGMSGLAIVIKQLANIKISYFLIFTTIILLSISYKSLGFEETKKALLGAIVFPIFVTITEPISSLINIELNSHIFSIFVSSTIYGSFLGLIYKVGYSTGGGDILNQIICKYAKLSIGTAGNYINLIIILISSFVFGINNTIYAIFSLLIINTIVDYIVLGNNDSKLCIIKTKNYKYLESFLLNEYDIGYSILEATSGSDKYKRKTIMCVVTSREYYKFKQMIKDIDSKAFFITHNCYESMGGKSKRLINLD